MSDPKLYTVGWICAIDTEYVAAQVFLDKKHEQPEYVSTHDNNDYTLGRIGKHNVVIAVLPDAEYGTASAASVARDMLHSFTNVRIGLMVGIGGGAPSKRHDVRLGDIVVSASRTGEAAVFQYDFGKVRQGQEFEPTRFLDQPPTLLRTAVNGLKAQYEISGHGLTEAVNRVLGKNPRLLKKYQKPETATDRLFKSHISHGEKCSTICNDDPSNFEPRPQRTAGDELVVHYGLIASANKLMKDALMRDKLANGKDILCFEMEAAGLMNHFPCLIIRGICDYSDSHKNKEWQGYAAMVAAAYAKDLLCRIAPNKVEAEETIRYVVNQVHDDVSKTKAGVAEIQTTLTKSEDLKILTWLTPVDYGPQQSDYLRLRQKGSGQWLLDSPELQHWTETSKQTLFCPGIPGAGKTIFTSIIVNELTEKFRGDATIGISYIYCNFRQQNEQRIEDLMASLLKQLAQQRDPLPGYVKKLYHLHEHTSTWPSLDEIVACLDAVVALYSRVFIIVDALDECKGPNGCRSTFLSEIFNLQERYEVNIFATSRFIDNILDRFKGCVHLEICARDEDIQKYLNGQMFRLPGFIKQDSELEEEIKAAILRSAKGMFLLARLHLDSLVGKGTIKQIRKALTNLPSGSDAYDQAYNETMERICDQLKDQVELAQRILSWITCARRRLTTVELQHALAVEVGQPELDVSNLTQIKDMVSVCAGLVTVDEDSNIIRLVHYTAQEYLERTQKQWFPNSQATIASSCVAYLSFRIFGSGVSESDKEYNMRLKDNPLYDYAARNWGYHAYDGSLETKLILILLEDEPKVFAASHVLLASPLPSHYMGGLHLAAYFGLSDAVAALIKDGKDVNSMDTRERTPLLWAAKRGHAGVVKVLLAERKIEPNYGDIYERKPLSWAARNGHEAVVKLLLERKDVNPNDKDLGPLTGLLGIMNTLQQIDEPDDEEGKWGGRTPLLWASANGHEGVVKLLLERGADPKYSDEDSKTPQWLAEENGHPEIVKLLKERKDDLNLKTARLSARIRSSIGSYRLAIKNWMIWHFPAGFLIINLALFVFLPVLLAIGLFYWVPINVFPNWQSVSMLLRSVKQTFRT